MGRRTGRKGRWLPRRENVPGHILLSGTKKTHHIVMCLTVQEKRLELSGYCYHTDLNRTRLQIPPFLHLLTAAFENHALSTKICYHRESKSASFFLKK